MTDDIISMKVKCKVTCKNLASEITLGFRTSDKRQITAHRTTKILSYMLWEYEI